MQTLREVALRKIKEKAFEHLSHGLIAEIEPTRPRKISYINYVDDFLVYEDDDENLIKQVTWLRWYLNQHGFPSDKVYFSGKNLSSNLKCLSVILSQPELLTAYFLAFAILER